MQIQNLICCCRTTTSQTKIKIKNKNYFCSDEFRFFLFGLVLVPRLWVQLSSDRTTFYQPVLGLIGGCDGLTN